jgi:FAD synthase
METIYLNPDNLGAWQQKARQSVMALGFFDGIHKGHREVITTAYQTAKEKNLLLTVISFFPHPKTVLSDGKQQVDYLMPLSDKGEILDKLGVDIFYIVEFDKEFSSLSPEQFVVNYVIDLGVVHAVAGFDYTYGFRGAGNMERMKSDSGGILDVTRVTKVEWRGEKISSSCIRERLSKGNVEELPAFLGRLYQVGCEWNGTSLQVRPYYTLPAPGRYAVTVKGVITSLAAEVVVTEKRELQSLQSFSGLTTKKNDGLSIIWHQRILDEMKDPFYGHNWLHSSFKGIVRSG